MRILTSALLAACLPFPGCKNSARNYPVNFVDRNVVFALEKKSQPLLLVVEINEAGKLRLNKIETGTIEDTTFLCERLKNIFADRARTSIGEREIVIDRQGAIKNEDVEKLIEGLASANAESILIIEN